VGESGKRAARLPAHRREESIRAWAQRPLQFDLFVVYIVMRHMTGGELARRLPHADLNVKVPHVAGPRDSWFNEKKMLWENGTHAAIESLA
jgi:hypothetical protein